MSEFRLDQAGLDESSGARRALVPLRKTLMRLLRPMLVQASDALGSFAARLGAAEARLDAMDARQDRQNDQLQDTIAFGWDYVAMARRIAALEDQMATALARQETARDAEGQMTLAFPEPATAGAQNRAS